MPNTLVTKHLIYKDEKKYFILALIGSIIGYGILLFSIVGFIFMLFFVGLSCFFHGLMIAQIRTNGVRLTSNQFPEVFEKAKELCRAMEIQKIPDIYVIESGGNLNAFATKFFGRNMVVLYSDIFDLINSSGSEELSFIIAHELAHIKRNHIMKQMLILPAMWIPFLGEAYSRSCEYTCDRMAANYINNKEAAVNGLTILAIGKSLFKKVNLSEYMAQSAKEKGFFIWLYEKISTHPPLPKRISEIQALFDDSSNLSFKCTKKPIWAIVGVMLIIFTFMGSGFLYADRIKIATNSFLTDFYSKDEPSIIIQAVLEGNAESVREQLESGINPDIQDVDGWTPLMWATQDNNIAIMWATQDNNIAMISLLVKAGADPNLQDFSEETALIKAISQSNLEVVKTLIEEGADPNLADSYGWTPLMSAATYGDIEVVRVLLEAGADPNSKDEDSFNAFLYAKKSGYNDIADLIKQHEKNTK